MPGKTLADLKRNPRDVTYAELRRILEDHGWAVREGTRHGAIAHKRDRTFAFPRPKRSRLLAVYVRRAIQVIEEED
ncbi:MAG: hypothetical protein KGJ98_03555 [Chloroflexota bacterium]|nr:hypothetical protein [Chloroflexota bacterium]MDE3101290.1 hypothetical protein [Chloroflexota bacterium]